jgi:hypothetical protein
MSNVTCESMTTNIEEYTTLRRRWSLWNDPMRAWADASFCAG